MMFGWAVVSYASVLVLFNGRAVGFGPGFEFNANRFQWNLEEIMTEAGSTQLKVIVFTIRRVLFLGHGCYI